MTPIAEMFDDDHPPEDWEYRLLRRNVQACLEALRELAVVTMAHHAQVVMGEEPTTEELADAERHALSLFDLRGFRVGKGANCRIVAYCDSDGEYQLKSGQWVTVDQVRADLRDEDGYSYGTLNLLILLNGCEPLGVFGYSENTEANRKMLRLALSLVAA